jgi:hypothetical protein
VEDNAAGWRTGCGNVRDGVAVGVRVAVVSAYVCGRCGVGVQVAVGPAHLWQKNAVLNVVGPGVLV